MTDGTIVKKILGENIRRLRLKTDMSQTQLAVLTRVSTRFIQKLEKGTGWPSASTYQLISIALRCEPHELLFHTGNGFKNKRVRRSKMIHL